MSLNSNFPINNLNTIIGWTPRLLRESRECKDSFICMDNQKALRSGLSELSINIEKHVSKVRYSKVNYFLLSPNVLILNTMFLIETMKSRSRDFDLRKLSVKDNNSLRQ